MTPIKLFLKTNLVLISSLIAFTTGSFSSHHYYKSKYNQQILIDRKVMLECQQAWEKYYALSQETKSIQFNLAQQLDKKIKLKAITKKLNSYGLEVEQKHLESFLNRSFNQAFGAIKYKTQELLPWVGYLAKFKETNQFSQEEQRQRVYYSEVLPKCQKCKDWQKQMNCLSQKVS